MAGKFPLRKVSPSFRNIFEKTDTYCPRIVRFYDGRRLRSACDDPLPLQDICDNECRANVQPPETWNAQDGLSMPARANIDDVAFFGCVFWGIRYFWRLMRGKVFDDFRNSLMDVLQPGIVQSAQRRVGYGQA